MVTKFHRNGGLRRGHEAWQTYPARESTKTSAYRIVCLAFIALHAVGCAGTRAGQSANQMNTELREARSATVDPEILRSSEALHAFLIGQLSYSKEDFKEAIRNLSRTSELLSSPAPSVHSRLAELYLREGNLQKAFEESRAALESKPSDVQLMLLHAGILETLGQLGESESLYRQAISTAPKMVEPYVLLSSVLLRQNQHEKSLEVLQSLERESPKDPLTIYYLGRAFEERGEFARAEQYYRKATRTEQERLGLTADLVRVLIKQKKVKEAKALCLATLAAQPQNQEVRKVLGHVYLAENNLDEALAQLKVLEGVEADATETRFKIALIYLEKRNYLEAIQELNLVLAQKPDSADARYYLATAFAGAAQFQEAIGEVGKINAKASTYSKAKLLEAFLRRQTGDLTGAVAAAEAGLLAESTNEQLFDLKVAVLRDLRRFDEAESALRQALEREPQKVKLLFAHALVLSDLGRAEEAEDVARRVLAQEPKNADALNFIAYSLAERGADLPTALSYIQQALQLQPNNAFYLDTEGWVYFQMGEYAKAVEVLERSSAQQPDDILLMEHLADAVVKSGEVSRGVSLYKTALTKKIVSSDHEQVEARDRIEEKLRALTREFPGLE